MKKDPKLIALHSHASNNEIEILKSKTCSCFFCRQTYSARLVNDWINDERGVTAICPECGMDAVIGDGGNAPLDKATLKELNLAYYGEDYMEKHPVAAQKYVLRYQKGKITHKAANEALYIQYLYSLASHGDADSAYALGQLFENGSEFTPADPKTAFSYYGMNCLSKDGRALVRLGVLSESGVLGKADPAGAYQCYAKAMAMGSLDGLIHFTDCYLHGIFVLPDFSFASECLTSIWDECYRRFVATTGKDINIFPQASYRLGVLFLEGKGPDKDPVLALRLFLYAEFGYALLKAQGPLSKQDEMEAADSEARIEQIAKTFKLRKQDPVFDNDTFADSQDNDNDLPSMLIGCVFTPGSFDKNQGLFDFDVTSDFPPLIVDCGNLYCGFVPGTIHWSFTDVVDVKLSKGGAFNRIIGSPDEGWSFLTNGPDEESVTVARIVLSKITPKKPMKERSAKGKA
jgi:TPR repeat protein